MACCPQQDKLCGLPRSMECAGSGQVTFGVTGAYRGDLSPASGEKDNPLMLLMWMSNATGFAPLAVGVMFLAGVAWYLVAMCRHAEDRLGHGFVPSAPAPLKPKPARRRSY